MKSVVLLFSLVFSGLAHAASVEEILAHSVVKTTYALMQAKHGGKCEKLTAESVRARCAGLIMPEEKLTLQRSSCGIYVSISCPGEYADLSGSDASVFVVDASGERRDIEAINLGITFDEISLHPSKK